MDTYKIPFQKLIKVLLVVFVAILLLAYLSHAHELKALFNQSQRCFVLSKIEIFTGVKNANCH